jgi:4'-phosphopantetheinyl transferase EntD
MQAASAGVFVRRELPHGLLVMVRASLGAWQPDPGAWKREGLHPGELARAATFGPARAVEFLAGRVALRHALQGCGWQGEGPLLAGAEGAPELPMGFAGSISHKTVGDVVLAVALAAAGEDVRLGVDLERLDAPPLRLERQVLGPEEARALEGLPDEIRWREVLLRFTAAEARWKALSVMPVGRSFYGLDARWHLEGPLLLATARVRVAHR